MPNTNPTRPTLTRAKRALCFLSFLQIVLGVVIIFLRIFHAEDRTSTLLGVVSGAANLITGCTALSVAIGNSDILTLLGKGSAIISCLCSVIVLAVHSTHWRPGDESSSNPRNPEHAVIPFVCIVINILEILCYVMLQKNGNEYAIVTDSRIGTFPAPESVSPHRDFATYGSVLPIEEIEDQRYSARPPAYSNPPEYTPRLEEDKNNEC